MAGALVWYGSRTSENGAKERLLAHYSAEHVEGHRVRKTSTVKQSKGV